MRQRYGIPYNGREYKVITERSKGNQLLSSRREK